MYKRNNKFIERKNIKFNKGAVYTILSATAPFFISAMSVHPYFPSFQTDG